MIDPRAQDDPKFIELLSVLKEWINDELASQRIIVQDIAEDLYDGQVLQKLLEKLTGDKLDVPEVTQSEEGQKQKLTVVLDHFNQVNHFIYNALLVVGLRFDCDITKSTKLVIVFVIFLLMNNKLV